MTRMLMFALVLLCSAAWLQAQDTSQQSPSAQAGAMSGQTSVEGCLQGSNGSFTITDSTGTAYQLEGDASMLSKHVGHEVKVIGTTSGSGDASSAAGASQGNSAQQTLTVQKVKHISDSCKTSSK